MKVALHENLERLESLKSLFTSWGIEISTFEESHLLIVPSILDGQKWNKNFVLWSNNGPSEEEMVSSLSQFCVALFSPSVLENTSGLIVFKRLLGLPTSLRPEENTENKVQKMSSYFIDNETYLSKGLDKIASAAGDFGISVSDVSLSVMSLMHYLSTLSKSEKCYLPFEVDYGQTTNDFFVQIHCRTNGVNKNDIVLGFSEKDKTKTYSHILTDVLSRTDILNVYTIEKNERLVVVCVWNKNTSRDYLRMLCLDFDINVKIENKIEHDSAQKYSEKEFSEIKNEAYKGSSLPAFEELNSGKLVRLKRLVTFIKKTRKKEVTSIAMDDLTTKHISNYLKKYPRQDIIDVLNENDKKFILKCLLDKEIDFSFNDNFKKIIEGKHDDDFYDNVISTVEKLSLEDLNEIALVEDESLNADSATKVRAWVEMPDVHKEVIKGKREDIGDKQHKTVVKGSVVFERPEDQVWTVKRAEIVTNLKEKIATLKSSNSPHQEVEQEIKKTLSHFLNVDSAETDTIVKSVFEFAAEPLVSLNLGTKPEEIKDRLENEKIKAQINVKDEQIKRMKRIIDGMKQQMIVMKQTSISVEELGSNGPAHYNNNIPTELRIQLEKAEKENDTLREQLESSERRNNALSENIDKIRNDKQIKDEQKEKNEADREMVLKFNLNEERKERLKANREVKNHERKIQELELMIEGLKKANSEGEIATLKDSLQDIQAELEFSKNENIRLTQEHTELSLNFKKLEHKNKLLVGQIEEANKKLNVNGNGAQAKGNGASEIKIKQLERVNQKLSASNKKNADDLADKKKEAIELNKEIVVLKNKMQELERKLLKVEKQAA